jgi:hypothetical protein
MIAPLVYQKKKVGVGFMPGSRLGYMPGARLGYTPGSHLGDFSPSMENAAVDANISPSDIDLLNNLGATDQDLENLMNGNVTLAQLYANYGATIPPATPTPSPTPQPPAASVGEIPPGSVLSWTVSYSVAIVGVNGGPPASSFIASFQAGLSQFNYSFIGANVLQSPVTGVLGGTVQIAFQILDNIGNAHLTDAKGNLEQLANSLTGHSVTASSIPQVISSPSGGGTPINPAGLQPASGLQWFENNAGMIALAVGAIVVLPSLIKKVGR